jgi:hypothetical protein
LLYHVKKPEADHAMQFHAGSSDNIARQKETQLLRRAAAVVFNKCFRDRTWQHTLRLQADRDRGR